MHKYRSMQNLVGDWEEEDSRRVRSTIDLAAPELVDLLAGSPPSPEGPTVPPTGGEAQIEQVNVPNPIGTCSGETPMESQCDLDTNSPADLGTDHAQCSSARRAALRTESICISPDSTFGQKLIMDPDVVGTLNPPGDKEVLSTFHGARAKKGGGVVNQSMTCTFDPRNLQCVTCNKGHNVVDGTKPVCVVISDQNFVPVWPGTGSEGCIAIVRVECASLHELTDLLLEIFESVDLPGGSVFLVGTVSYLHRVGVSAYARDWTQIVARLGRRWPNVRVGPLTPVLRETVPGGVTRALIELAAWFSKVYTGNIQGMDSSWTLLINKVIMASAGHTTLSHVEVYSLSLPVNLDPGCGTAPTNFMTNSSRPSTLAGMDEGIICELLSSIANVLKEELKISIGVSLGNALRSGGAQENIERVVLIGASNLKQVANHLKGLGLEVIDLCVPGWVISPSNVEDLIRKLEVLGVRAGTAVVSDLFGNSVFRFKEFDGTVSKPLKGGGGTTWQVKL